LPECPLSTADGVKSIDVFWLASTRPELVERPVLLYATAELGNIVQTTVDNHNVAITGQAEWYPVAFFLREENGEVLGGLLGNIWAAWLHVRTLAVAAPARGRGFGRDLMKRAELYALERGCTDAFLDTFSFQARPFYEKLGYRVFGMLENYPAGYQHYFMTKQL
jgi:GNAT superfamily N-acetyltransferase